MPVFDSWAKGEFATEERLTQRSGQSLKKIPRPGSHLPSRDKECSSLTELDFSPTPWRSHMFIQVANEASGPTWQLHKHRQAQALPFGVCLFCWFRVCLRQMLEPWRGPEERPSQKGSSTTPQARSKSGHPPRLTSHLLL